MAVMVAFILLLAAGLPGQTAYRFVERRIEGVVPAMAVVRAADLDRDGDLDLAVGNFLWDGDDQPMPNRIYINRGRGRFTPFAGQGFSPVGTYTNQLFTIDVDGDGWVDIVESTRLNLFIYLNKGRGKGFWRRALHIKPLLPGRSVALADLNGDGRVELALLRYVAKADRIALQVFSQVGRCEFEPTATIDLGTWLGHEPGEPTVLFARLGPGPPQLIITSCWPGGFEALACRVGRKGTVPPPRVLLSHRGRLAPCLGGTTPLTRVADLDGDRRHELVLGVADRSTCTPRPQPTVLARRVGGTGPLAVILPHAPAGANLAVEGLWPLDLDRDGREELVILGWPGRKGAGGGMILTRLADGKLTHRVLALDPGPRLPHSITLGRNLGTWADMDGDGRPDYICKRHCVRKVLNKFKHRAAVHIHYARSTTPVKGSVPAADGENRDRTRGITEKR